MIAIKQFGDKWRVHIREEVWQFETKKEFDDALKKLIDLKSKHGNIKEE